MLFGKENEARELKEVAAMARVALEVSTRAACLDLGLPRPGADVHLKDLLHVEKLTRMSRRVPVAMLDETIAGAVPRHQLIPSLDRDHQPEGAVERAQCEVDPDLHQESNAEQVRRDGTGQMSLGWVMDGKRL